MTLASSRKGPKDERPTLTDHWRVLGVLSGGAAKGSDQHPDTLKHSEMTWGVHALSWQAR